MVLFARLNPDTPGKLAAHGYSYEHMELAAYELLSGWLSARATATSSRSASASARQERAMADRVAERWDRAVDASLKEKSADDLDKEVVKYLRDAHAIEGQAIALLETGPKIAGFDALKHVFARAPARDTRAPAHDRRAPRASSAAARRASRPARCGWARSTSARSSRCSPTRR